MLDSPRGMLVTETIFLIEAKKYKNIKGPHDIIYYYLSVGTVRRWPLPHDLRILIIRLEPPDPGGLPTTVWTGKIPFGWEHGQIQPASSDPASQSP